MSPGTKFLIGKVRIEIKSNDHNPPHVHVVGPDRKAKITIEDQVVLENKGFSRQDLKAICEKVRINRVFLKEQWDETHKNK